MNIVAAARERRFRTGESAAHRRVGLGEMAFADGDAVENGFGQLGAAAIRLRTRAEVVFDIFPRVDRALAERAAGFEARMHHAVLATRIAAAAFFVDAVLGPVNLLREF